MELAGQVGSARGQADEARPVRRGRSIEYWFRCMDLDGDGVLSMFELEYFYEEQCRRLDSMAIEALPFEDCLCQMLDLVKPQNEGNSCRGHPVTCDSHSGRASLLRGGDGWAGPQGGAYRVVLLETVPRAAPGTAALSSGGQSPRFDTAQGVFHFFLSPSALP